MRSLMTRNSALDLFDEMDRFFGNFLWERPRFYDERSFHPACEISETDDHYLMSVDLPGMKKDEIRIEVTDNILTISGERRREHTVNSKERVQRYEKSYGFFKRSFSLPASIEADKVEARYEDGVLEVYLPKTQASKPRRIEIKSGKSGIFSKLLGSVKGQDLKEAAETNAS